MWQVIGHEQATSYLARAIEQQQVAHAYLFTGPPNVGKMTLAMELARALNCQGDAPPCHVCRACRLITNENYPDVRTVRVQPEKRDISIDAVRKMREDVSLSAYEGRWKVYVIEDAQLLSLEAKQSVLKTLEEPPSGVVLVLTAPSGSAMLPTIVSRCRLLSLHGVSPLLIEQTLRDRGVAAERARLLAGLSEGRVGWALDTAATSEALAARERLLDDLAGFLGMPIAERLAWARRVSDKQARQLPLVLSAWQSWWRDLLLIGEGLPEQIVNVDRRDALTRDAKRLQAGEAAATLRAGQRAREALKANGNTRLTMEVMALAAPTRAASGTKR